MARVKGGTVTRARRNRVLHQAEGYFGSKHILFKTAKEQVCHSLRYAYISRRLVKRDYRKLWIRRINAACRVNDISYSKFMIETKIVWSSIASAKTAGSTVPSLRTGSTTTV